MNRLASWVCCQWLAEAEEAKTFRRIIQIIVKDLGEVALPRQLSQTKICRSLNILYLFEFSFCHPFRVDP